jgi:hypothetical protein
MGSTEPYPDVVQAMKVVEHLNGMVYERFGTHGNIGVGVMATGETVGIEMAQLTVYDDQGDRQRLTKAFCIKEIAQYARELLCVFGTPEEQDLCTKNHTIQTHNDHNRAEDDPDYYGYPPDED